MSENIDKEFIRELAKTFSLAGFGTDFISVVSSYFESENKEECLKALQTLNKTFSKLDAQRISKRLTIIYPEN
jgi:hypothetical protein